MIQEKVRPSVLIAEDEEPLREALCEMVANEGYRVVGSAGSGNEAVELATQWEPDVAILDYRMPGMDGVEATELIKEASPKTQVIMYTAYDEQSLALDATRSGVFTFLVKGSPPSMLLRALELATSQGAGSSNDHQRPQGKPQSRGHKFGPAV
jgi:DNA-binding NarL/FixJ family response regulator